MRLLIFLKVLSILGLGQSIDLSTLQDIEDLMVFIKGAGNRLSEAADELNGIEIDGTKKYADVIDKYLLQVDHTDEDGEKYQNLKDLVEKIDQAWDHLGTKNPGNDDKTQLAALAMTRNELYNFYVQNETTFGLPIQIVLVEEPSVCERTMPQQLRLKAIHQAVALSELRAFILGLKAGDDNQKAIAKGILQSEEYILTSKLGLELTENDFRACDPPEHIRGKTFGELLGLFQGVVVNNGHTDNMNKTGKCGESCNELDEAKIDRCYKQTSEYGQASHCHRKKCLGRLFDCIHVDSVEACELDPKSDRRFSWAHSSGDNRTYGKEGSCKGNEVDIPESGSPQGNSCVTCLCVCAEEDSTSKAIRSVSLLPQFADIQKNMIVTGVRFQEKDELFHVQIEESKLGPLGEIVPGTSSWKKLDSFSYDPETGSFKVGRRLNKKQLYNNFGYKMFDRDCRGLNLDLVETPYGEVVVGVSLAYAVDDDAVQIEILSWPFDFKTGELKDPINLEDGKVVHDWINWENTPRKSYLYEGPRFQIDLNNLDDPVLSLDNLILSGPNDKIEFGATGFESDMAQHTIPYLSLRDITYSDKKSSIGGLMLYYGHAEGYGGFLGFKIQGYDFSNNFQDQMTQEDIDKYKADFDGELAQEIPVKAV